MAKRIRARNWCFTLNNYTNVDEVNIQGLESTYLVYGREKGESGTPHLQGYVEFENPRAMSSIKKLTSDKIHLERRKGTAQQAALYCKKDGDVYESGTISRQGSRTDLEDVAELIKQRCPLIEIASEHPTTFVKYHRGLQALKYQLHGDRDKDHPPVIAWYWGKTGVGKTRFAYEFHDGNVYIKDGTSWWDGYEQQEGILIDDFDGKWPFRNFLRLLDRYPYQGEIKGGWVKINSPYIHITCSYPPGHWYRGDDLEQVERRLDGRIFHLE